MSSRDAREPQRVGFFRSAKRSLWRRLTAAAMPLRPILLSQAALVFRFCAPQPLVTKPAVCGRFRLYAAAAVLAGLAALPAFGKTAVVLNSDDDSLSVIDTESYKEITRTYIGRQPHHLIASPDKQTLILAMAGGNELVFIDRPTGEIKQRLQVSDPYQVGFSPDAKWFVTTSLRLDRIDIYNAATYQLVYRLAAPKTPSHIGFSPDSRTV